MLTPGVMIATGYPTASAKSKVNRKQLSQVRRCTVEDKQRREEFDTGLARIRHEIKGRLVQHGFFGSVTYRDIEAADHILSGSTVEIAVKGKTAERSFSRQEIEGCRLRVGGAVLSGVISMVDELSA
jgi:hypothetical protein